MLKNFLGAMISGVGCQPKCSKATNPTMALSRQHRQLRCKRWPMKHCPKALLSAGVVCFLKRDTGTFDTGGAGHRFTVGPSAPPKPKARRESFASYIYVSEFRHVSCTANIVKTANNN